MVGKTVLVFTHKKPSFPWDRKHPHKHLSQTFINYVNVMKELKIGAKTVVVAGLHLRQGGVEGGG